MKGGLPKFSVTGVPSENSALQTIEIFLGASIIGRSKNSVSNIPDMEPNVIPSELVGYIKNEHAFGNIISDIDSGCFEQLKGTTEATTPLGIIEKPIIIDEELSISQNMPSIHRIIRSDACAIITDTKIISNKVMVKGNLKIDICYCSA